MLSSVFRFAQVETGILADLKLRELGSLARSGATSLSTWTPAAVLTVRLVRPSITVSRQLPVLQPGSTAAAFPTSLTMTPTSPLQVSGFVSRRMLESTATPPAITSAYFWVPGPEASLTVTWYLPVFSSESQSEGPQPAPVPSRSCVPSPSGSNARKIASVVFWPSLAASTVKAPGLPRFARLQAPSEC